jgi:RNA polymerase sigma-70 factor (ECF subfamily)
MTYEAVMLGQVRPTTAELRALDDLFERLYATYNRPLYNYIYRLVGNWEQAEDLTQEVFLKAYNALGRLPADANHRAWLYRIATNASYDVLRRRRLIQWLPFFENDRASEFDDPARYTADALAVQAALQRLPADQRTSLLLYVCDHFSTEEIAEIMGCSRGAVKTRLFRARERFRQIFPGGEENLP